MIIRKVAFCLFVWMSLSLGAHAANLLWNAPDGGAWSAPSSWTPNEAPDSADDIVRFAALTPGAVTTNDIPGLQVGSCTPTSWKSFAPPASWSGRPTL
jgi:hypothetical protein